MQEFVQLLQSIIDSSFDNARIAFTFLAILWLCQIINKLLNLTPNKLGIIPRTFIGLRGIIFAPFLHADFNHLFFNSIPFIILSVLVLMNGSLIFYTISLFIILVGGLLLWLIGKRGIHIGASTLIMGYFGFLFSDAYFQFDAKAIILAILCLYYLSWLFMSLLPGKKEVSWEGHVCGFVAGLLAAYVCPRYVYPLILKVFSG